MNEILGLVHAPIYKERVDDHMSRLQALSYDTIVRATSGKTTVNDYEKVCYDSYREITANIKETLAMIRRDFIQKQDIVDVIHAVQLDFNTHIRPKWKEMSAQFDRCVPQLFQDATSEHIYCYNAAMEVSLLLKKLCYLFNKHESIQKSTRSKLLSTIYKKCMQYSKDELFISSAGKPLKAIGYIDIAAIYDVSNAYGHIVQSLDTKAVTHTLDKYKQSVRHVEASMDTLSAIAEKNIVNAEVIDDAILNQYKTLLSKALSLESVYRLSIVVSGLLSSLQKTVQNITTAAYNSRTGEILKNMTEPMGGTLTPTVIETQSIANERFLQMVDLSTTMYPDNMPSLEQYTHIATNISTIEKYKNEDDVGTYLKNKKWRSLSLEKLNYGMDTLYAILHKQERFCHKFRNTHTYVDIFPYPNEKQFNIPEIIDLHHAASILGTELSVSGYTVDGNLITNGKPIQSWDIMDDNTFTVHHDYTKKIQYPSLGIYTHQQYRLTNIPLLTGNQIGISTIQDLYVLQKLVETHSPRLIEICAYGPRTENMNIDKHSHAIMNDPNCDYDYKVMTRTNYYRSVVWMKYFWFIVDMYAWSIHMCDHIVCDILQYS